MGSPLAQPVAACRTQPFTAARGAAVVVRAAEGERLRLHNLSPQKGSRRDEKRKGRGYGGHQVRTAAGPMGERGRGAGGGSTTARAAAMARCCCCSCCFGRRRLQDKAWCLAMPRVCRR